MSVEAVNISKDASSLSSEHPDIIRAAEYSYRFVADREGYDREKVHRMQICSWIAMPMKLHLRQQGYQLWSIGRELNGLRVWPEHMYFRSAETPRGLIVVDATWQQFLPRSKRDPSLPKVMVGTPDEVITFAKDAGVRNRNLDFWKKEPSLRVKHENDDRFSFGLYD